MRLTTRIGIGLAAVVLALATADEAGAQAFGVPGFGYRYRTPYYGGIPAYGYGSPYGYGPGYGYAPGYGYYGRYPYYGYYIPQTYNNLNGLGGLIGGTVAPRSTRAFRANPYGW